MHACMRPCGRDWRLGRCLRGGERGPIHRAHALDRAPSLSFPPTSSLSCPFSLPLSFSVPDGAARCKTEWGIVRSTWARRADLPSGEAGMYALFVGELFAWACVGEIVGRGGTFGGYQV